MTDDIEQSLSDSIRIIDMYLDEESFDQAMEYANRTNEKYQALLPQNHPQMLLLHMKTGTSYAGKDLFNEAMQAFMKGLQIRKELNEHEIAEAEIRVSIGKCYYHLHNDKEAMEWVMNGLDLYCQDPAPDPGKMGIAYGAIADILNSQCNYQEAIEWYFKAIEHNEKNYGRKNEYNGTLHLNLARAYRFSRQLNKALAAAQKALSVFDKQAVRNTTDIAVTQSIIALLLEETGQNAKANEFLTKVKTTYDKDHALTRSTKLLLAIDIGQFHLMKKDAQQASAWLLKAVAIAEKDHDKYAYHAAIAAQGLGYVYESQQNYQLAIKWYEKQFNACLKRFGPRHQQTADSLVKIANCRTLSGQVEKAAEELKQAIDILLECSNDPMNHSLTLAYLLTAKNHYEQKQYEPAEQYYLKSLETISDAGPKQHQTAYLEAVKGLTRLYYDQKNFRKAMIAVERGIDIATKLYGAERYATLMAMCTKAKIYAGMEDYGQSLNTYAEIIKISIKKFGVEGDITKSILADVYQIYERADMPYDITTWLFNKVKIMPTNRIPKKRKR
ncbi:MAG: tetratricopeptide repeat protein [Tannerellaceae bacterium]|jgi:tetratricopeptide (TPR) repeat protein|nr:tetratricopeptide repeat protein [Tannerellaceae bacterium]